MKRIIIDCDPGIDDAQAIMMAYQHPEVKIEAITSVAGNVGVEKTTANVLKILDVLDAGPIPVYAGAHSGIVEEGLNASSVHGEDGLGGVDLPVSKRKIEDKPAALALIDLANQQPGELELIAIGPLTNLALALRLDPELPSTFKKLVIMGGAYYGKGNTTNFTSEFNLFADPDAAAVVFSNWPELTMISWEATMTHGIPIEDLKGLMAKNNARSQFIREATKKLLDLIQEVFNQPMSYAADPLAMAVAVEPEIILESVKKFIQIERYGQLSRGMTVVDWWNTSKRKPNTTIVTKVDHKRFLALLKMAFD